MERLVTSRAFPGSRGLAVAAVSALLVVAGVSLSACSSSSTAVDASREAEGASMSAQLVAPAPVKIMLSDNGKTITMKAGQQGVFPDFDEGDMIAISSIDDSVVQAIEMRPPYINALKPGKTTIDLDDYNNGAPIMSFTVEVLP
jgi:hypothetical protein